MKPRMESRVGIGAIGAIGGFEGPQIVQTRSHKAVETRVANRNKVAIIRKKPAESGGTVRQIGRLEWSIAEQGA